LTNGAAFSGVVGAYEHFQRFERHALCLFWKARVDRMR
jgi:hypothetical protein